MKTAIATDGGEISSHFGRCPLYTLVEFREGKAELETISNPGHHPGFLPRFFYERGVKRVVAGGMGARAREMFRSYGIETVLGIEGPVEDAVRLMSAGMLSGGESLCRPHAGRGYGIEKTDCDHGGTDNDGHDCGRERGES